MTSASTLLVGLTASITFGVQAPALQSRLTAADTRTRMAAVADLARGIDADPLLLTEASIQEAVVRLLEIENATVAQNTAAFLKSGKDQLSEAYSEHYAVVLGLANQVRNDWRLLDPLLLARLRRALVLGVYNPDSVFVKDIAREGEPIVPVVLELTRSAWGPSRWNGYALIGALFAQQEARALTVNLTAKSATRLRAAAREGLLDPAPDVRKWAIRAVVDARDKEAIPLLQGLAQSDPDVDTGAGRRSVRALAAEALRRLR
jgi:hypothetical protein